jgi:hypothetical protein
VSRDKKDDIKKSASQTENAAGQGDLKDLYLTRKKKQKPAGKFQQTDKPIKDNSLTSTEEQPKDGKNISVSSTPETPSDISPAETELPTN